MITHVDCILDRELPTTTPAPTGMANGCYIAIGANFAPKFRGVADALRWGVASLRAEGLSVVSTSGLYATAPVGGAGRQPAYMNAVVAVRTDLAPGQLLRLLKRIEQQSGRRRRGLNAPRPLDLDVIDYGGRRLGLPAGDRAGRRAQRRNPRAWITLPHPEMHRRRFVLEPLVEIAPHWHHPVLRMSVRQLLCRLPRPPGLIRRALDSRWLSCDING